MISFTTPFGKDAASMENGFEKAVNLPTSQVSFFLNGVEPFLRGLH